MRCCLCWKKFVPGDDITNIWPRRLDFHQKYLTHAECQRKRILSYVDYKATRRA
jgi:hypothetical protein